MGKVKVLFEKILRWLEKIHLIQWVITLIPSSILALISGKLGQIVGVKAAYKIPFIIITFAGWFVVFLVLVVYLYNKYNDKFKLWSFKMSFPIIFIAIGIISFGFGIIWFNIEQSTKLESINIKLSNLSKTIDHQLEKINKLEDFAKKQSWLHVLKRELPKVEDLKEKYEQKSKEMLDSYLPGSGRLHLVAINNVIGTLQSEIDKLAKNVFNENIAFNIINASKYDEHKPFEEEVNIDDETKRYEYRKAKYKYLSNVDAINNFISKINKEIGYCEGLINNFGVQNIQMSK